MENSKANFYKVTTFCGILLGTVLCDFNIELKAQVVCETNPSDLSSSCYVTPETYKARIYLSNLRYSIIFCLSLFFFSFNTMPDLLLLLFFLTLCERRLTCFQTRYRWCLFRGLRWFSKGVVGFARTT